MRIADQIPLEKLFEIIDDCGEMGVKAITFSGGGEPLLYKGLMSVLERCADKGISTAILTNGVLLKQALLMVAMDHCSWIRISMDGWDRDSYAAYRKCQPEDFHQLMNNIECAMRMKSKCVLGVNIIVDDKNCTHLYDMVKMVHKLGVRSIKVSPCIVSNDIAINHTLHYKIEPFVNEQIDKIKADGIEIYNSYHAQLEGFKKSYCWCPYIQILPIIGADLNVYSCHDKAYNKTNGIIGSIRDQSFKKFWYDGKDKFYKIDPRRDCNHHCVTDQTNKMLFEYLSIDHEEFC
jgi:MoaA/NifB/PqqE/SkfB family radical SAM enzyme